MKEFDAKLLFSGSTFIPLYFLFLYFVNLYKIDFVLIGVFMELLTIPLLFGIILFLILDIIFLFQKNKKSEKYLVLIGFLVLGLCFFLILKSF